MLKKEKSSLEYSFEYAKCVCMGMCAWVSERAQHTFFWFELFRKWKIWRAHRYCRQKCVCAWRARAREREKMEVKWKFFGNFNVAFVRGVRAIHSKMQYTPYKMHKPHRTAHKNLICIISFVAFCLLSFRVLYPSLSISFAPCMPDLISLLLHLFMLSSPSVLLFFIHSSTILLLLLCHFFFSLPSFDIIHNGIIA